MNGYFSTRTARMAALLVIFAFGIIIRLFDLTDLPLDFHPTRQLHSLLKARGMYYETRRDVPPEERTFAIDQWKASTVLEPEVLEHLVAFTYRFTGEQIWVARIYSSIFWLIGGIFLYLLARKLSSEDGAIVSVAVYVLLPYAVMASRSFQPDPLMMMLLIMFWWAVWEWSSLTPSSGHPPTLTGTRPNGRGAWVRAFLAGLFGGLAIFIKFPAVFFVAGGGLGALLSHRSVKETFKNPQLYVLVLMGILPGSAYFLYSVQFGDLGERFGGRFIPSLLASPSYYLGWLNMLEIVTGGALLTLALLGLFFFEKMNQRFLLGPWAGYAIFGIYFNHHISTHDYYSLPLIPIAALSLAPLADSLLSKLSQHTSTRLLRLSSFLFLLFGITASVWNTRNQLNAMDYRPEAAMWAEIHSITKDYNLAGLTQDYGARYAYWGWQSITSWPSYGDIIYKDKKGAQQNFDERFADIITKKDLFIVTDFNDLKLQPFLEEKLKTYPVFAEGDGYIIYQLR